ncbi:VOC family protein [Micromonospora sp. WMMD812]|uniref:VOC family protein n=1 Tax=Micromonospora sp. WMMD812 TaxID=3015152 RepID=UPI00248C34F5|nr:VOC family protein [Micromonospora sp. WMMD812]WBB67132.1 VOC family protein [Micromonospora sp. WMMD812]
MTISNAVTWFEIGTERPDEAQRFYGDLFGWTFSEEGAGEAYRTTEGGAGAGIGGAIRGTGGTGPNYAIFYVQVADVAETCRRAEAAGGKVLVPAKTNDNGLSFAHLLDPAGNHVGVFTPPAGS